MDEPERRDVREAEGFASDRASWRWWLALRRVRGIGPVLYRKLLQAFAHPQTVFAAPLDSLLCAGLRPDLAQAIRRFDAWAAVDGDLQKLRMASARLVTWADEAYPPRLRHIHDPPPFLFVQGSLIAADEQAIAVVGSRNVSAYGLRMARDLSAGLAERGLTVVSGLARGTDAAAHAASLRVGGRTIAVLGSGVDVIYPPEHRELAKRIARQGAVVSEFDMGTAPDAENFPGRNRIISGMTLGTLVIEAAEKSGSLITAHLAADQGREVFAVPGPVGARHRGVHRLIRLGAKLTQCVEDIVEELGLPSTRPTDPTVPCGSIGTNGKPGAAEVRGGAELPSAGSPGATVLTALQAGSCHVDDLCRRLGVPMAELLPLLLEMELQGWIRSLPGMHFAAGVVDDPGSVAKGPAPWRRTW